MVSVCAKWRGKTLDGATVGVLNLQEVGDDWVETDANNIEEASGDLVDEEVRWDIKNVASIYVDSDLDDGE